MIRNHHYRRHQNRQYHQQDRIPHCLPRHVLLRNKTPALSCVTTTDRRYVYFEDEPCRCSAAKLLTRNEGWRDCSERCDVAGTTSASR
jgi:hypothetical protein